MEIKFRYEMMSSYGCRPLAAADKKVIEIPEDPRECKALITRSAAVYAAKEELAFFAVHPARYDCTKLLLDIFPKGGVAAAAVNQHGKVRYIYSSLAAIHYGTKTSIAMDNIYEITKAMAMGYVITGYEDRNWILTCPLPAEKQANGYNRH